MQPQDKAISAMQETILATPGNLHPWLGALTETFGLSHCFLTVRTVPDDSIIFSHNLENWHYVTGWSPKRVEYYDRYLREDDYHTPVERSLRFKTAATMRPIFASRREDIDNHVVFDEMVRAEGLWDCIGKELFRNEEYRVFLNAFFPKGYNVEPVISVLEAIGPFIEFAIAGTVHTSAMNPDAEYCTRSNLQGRNEMLVRHGGKVEWVSSRAQKTLERGTFFSVRNDTLFSLDQGNSALHQMIKDTFRFFQIGAPAPTISSLAVWDSNRQRHCHITAIPFFGPATFGVHLAPKVLLVIVDPDDDGGNLTREKLRVYGFTDQQIESAVQTFLHPTINSYVESSGRREDEVRNDLRKMYNSLDYGGTKTGDKRLSALIGRLIPH